MSSDKKMQHLKEAESRLDQVMLECKFTANHPIMLDWAAIKFALVDYRRKISDTAEAVEQPLTQQGSEPSEILQHLNKAIDRCREGYPKFAITHIEDAAKLLPC